MRKGTIFKYEFKRLLFSREYLLLLVITLLFSVTLLFNMVLFGANYTAPFSKLSFSTYISSVSPILFILLLALCARQFTPSERGAASIISAVPMPASTFQFLRYGTIACAFTIAAALPFAACFMFYRLVFDYTAIGNLFWLGLLLLLPPAILLFGAAMLLGSKKSAAIYVLLAVLLILGVFQISLPGFFDLIGSSAVQPPDTGAPDFSLTPAFIAGRAVFSGMGIVLILISLFQTKRRLV